MEKVITMLAIVAFALISCKGDDTILLNKVKKQFVENEIVFDETTKHCVIIPEGGCGGCIASGISFIVDHKEQFSKNQKEDVVVFTNIGSLKLLKRAVGESVFNSLNCIVDTANAFLVEGNDDIYPIIIYLRKNTPIKVEFQSPKEDGLRNLEREL